MSDAELRIDVVVVDCRSHAIDARLPTFRALIPGNDRERIEAYASDDDRRAHTVSSALLRIELSRRLGVEPGAIDLTRTTLGKPVLRGPPDLVARAPAFNVSQSGRWAAAAFAPAGDIGVDIERLNPKLDVIANAEGAFSLAERQLLAAQPAPLQRHLFFRLWTLKEAYAKALGTGMSTPFDSFSALPVDALRARLVGTDDRGWWLSSFEFDDDYGGAVAFRHASPQVAEPVIRVTHDFP